MCRPVDDNEEMTGESEVVGDEEQIIHGDIDYDDDDYDDDDNDDDRDR